MAKGHKTGGRQKGTPNKMNVALKEMVLGALADCGGGEYLKQQAIDNPTAFMTLLGKILPTQVSTDPDQPIKTVMEIVWGGSKS